MATSDDAQAPAEESETAAEQPADAARKRTSTSRYRRQSQLEKAAGEAAWTAARELIKSIFTRHR